MTHTVRRFASDYPKCSPFGKIHSPNPGTPCASLISHEGRLLRNGATRRIPVSLLPTTQRAHAARTRLGRGWPARLGCCGARGKGGRGVERALAGALSLHRGPSTTFSKRACRAPPSPLSSHTSTPQSDETASRWSHGSPWPHQSHRYHHKTPRNDRRSKPPVQDPQE